MPVRCATVTWLICDYGEVISLPQPPGDLAAVESAAGVAEPGSFWASYWRHRPAYDRADVTSDQYWELVLGAPPASTDLRRLVAADVGSWLHPNPASIRAVSGLKARGVRLALFSNAPVDLADRLQDAPWLEPFSEKFFSCRIKATKPDAAAYNAILGELGIGAEDAVFVDDRPANVEGARAVGMRAFVFEGAEQLAGLL